MLVFTKSTEQRETPPPSDETILQLLPPSVVLKTASPPLADAAVQPVFSFIKSISYIAYALTVKENQVAPEFVVYRVANLSPISSLRQNLYLHL